MKLPAVHVAARLARLRVALEGAEVDALVVSRLPNIRYLTGFTGSAGTLVVDRASDEAVLLTDGRYREQAHEQLALADVGARVEVGPTAREQRERLVVVLEGRRRVGLEAHGVTWATQRAWAKALGEEHELVATEGVVEELRRVKEPGEIARIEAACHIGDDAFAEVSARLGDGPTEIDVALELDLAMRRRGATGMSFDPIVASGPNAAMPHARPTPRPIGRGELVVCDFGCVVDGYCSDMTRTVSVGEPTSEARALYELVLEAQQTARDTVRAGTEVAAVDAAARDVIVAAGHGEQFVHGTGHGVGVEIHEAPRVARTASDTLRVGDVVTVEPGVYLPGVGGVRIEDTVAVSAEGSRPLTTAPKELVL